MSEKCGNDDYDDYIDPVEILTDLYPEKDFFYLEDYNDAILGIVDNKLVYSKTLILDILCDREEIDYEEAVKYYENNIENSYFGDKTPIFLNDDLTAIIQDFYDESDNGIIKIPFSLN